MFKKIDQAGLSLIELIVAMLVSSIILIAVMNLYVGFGSSSRDKEKLSTSQDKAYFALNELAYQVRMSGAGLCAKPVEKKLQMNPEFSAVVGNEYKNIPLTQNIQSFNDIRLRSFHDPSADNLDSSLPVVANSDALLLTYTSPSTVRITDVAGVIPKEDRTLADDMLLSRFHSLVLSSPLGTVVERNDGTNAKNIWLMVSDCDYSEVVYYPTLTSQELGASVLPAPTAPNEGFKRKYYHTGQVGMVAPLVSKIFYIAQGENGSALYEKNLLATSSDNAVSLMDGVTGMQIEYLYDDGTGTSWHNTADRTNWDSDVPLRITLTMDEGGEENEKRSFTRIIDSRN